MLLFVCTVISKVDQNDDTMNIMHEELTVPESVVNDYHGLYRRVRDQFSAVGGIKYRQSKFSEKLPAMPSWESRNLLQHTSKLRYKAFAPRINQLQHTALVDLLKVFSDICEQNEIMYMLYGGSLLGSFRHFGLIPWDDDIDVLMNFTDSHRLKHLLSINEYSIESPDNRQWKFYKRQHHTPCNPQTSSDTDDSTIRTNCDSNGKWPYIDIFLFSENDTHIWDSTPMYEATYIYSKRDVFPLTYSPFEAILLPIPKCPLKVLSKTYNTDFCVTSTYSHIYEYITKNKQISVPCKRLFEYFPFVFETEDGDFVNRRLVFKTKLVFESRLSTTSC